MCGIFGMFSGNSERIPDRAKLEASCRALKHRGPDGDGIFSAPGIGLVHTRLSLLDLAERSNQPFWDRQKRYVLVFNGEIYNFQELREELEKTGVQFRTTSDTEVLLEALLKWGPDLTLPRLEGMFAFGLYDCETKSLLLARDRFGIKPLFVCETEDMFLFGSEIGSLRPWIRFEPDLLSISGLLYGFSGPFKGFTLYKHIHAIEPGGVVKVQHGKPTHYSRFFFLGDFVDPKEMDRLEALGDEQIVDEVDRLLNESIKAQLVADAPVGSLCSGGLDSSIIMAIATRYHNNLAIFHANIVGPVSEYPAALQLSKYLKLDLNAAEVKDLDFLDEIPTVTEHFGQPFFSCPHSLPMMMVCRLVRERGVKAVLSGEASDEYFHGYAFCSPDIRQYLGVRPMLRLVKRWLRSPLSDTCSRYLGPAYIQSGDFDSPRGMVHALHNRFEVAGDMLRSRADRVNDSAGRPYQGALRSVDLLGYNLRALLHRNDTMGMAAGVEARFPFLESKLAKVAINMPLRCKVRFSWSARDPAHYFFQDKWIVRKLAERYLPSQLFKQDKKPFPINAYTEQRMKISPEYFQGSFITELFELGESEEKIFFERSSHWLKWKMLLLDVWADVCLKGVPRPTVAEKLRKHISISNADYSGFFH